MTHNLIGSTGKKYGLSHACEPSGIGPVSYNQRSNTVPAFSVGDLVQCSTCGKLWYCNDISVRGTTLYWRRGYWFDRWRVAYRTWRRQRKIQDQIDEDGHVFDKVGKD